MHDLRNLPDPVKERLGDFLTERSGRYRRGFDVVQRNNLLEARGMAIGAGVELRATESGDPILDGYATIYEYPYDVAGGAPYGWSETIAEGAAAVSVAARDDVRLLVDHEGIALARTKSGTLTLESDTVGLRMSTPQGVDMRSPLVQSVTSALQREDLDEMSFAFRVLRQEWNDDYTERRITEVKLFDVSVVTFPANPATVVQMRDEPAPTGRTSVAYAAAIAQSLRV